MDAVKTWEHAGMTCVMRRGFRGIPCGYVALPEGHPLHGVEYQDMDDWPDVHGGVTWTGALVGCSELGWLIGFDMGHDGDFECDPGGEIRFIGADEACVSETNRLAEQMARWGVRGEKPEEREDHEVSEELKRCPFCGGEADVHYFAHDDSECTVMCSNPNCRASVSARSCGSMTAAYNRARKLWNRRAERTCTVVHEEGGFPHCSRCGALEVVDDVAGPLNYCPMCGAKVVSE